MSGKFIEKHVWRLWVYRHSILMSNDNVRIIVTLDITQIQIIEWCYAILLQPNSFYGWHFWYVFLFFYGTRIYVLVGQPFNSQWNAWAGSGGSIARVPHWLRQRVKRAKISHSEIIHTLNGLQGFRHHYCLVNCWSFSQRSKQQTQYKDFGIWSVSKQID